VYCCTWRGCSHQAAYQSSIETHVRKHLGRPEPKDGDERDFEEEFYYTEIDSDEQPSSEEYIDIMEADIIIDNHTPPAFGEHNYINSKPLSTIDHTFNKTQPQTTCGEHTFNQTLPLPTFGNQSSKSIQPSFSLEKYPRQSSASPPSSLATSAPSSVSLLRFIPTGISEHLDMVKSPALYFVPDSQKRWDEPGKKLVSIVPKPEAHSRTPVKPFIFTPTPPNNIIKSDRKCRKIYGLDGKDEWCTQCKWKKACARFS